MFNFLLNLLGKTEYEKLEEQVFSLYDDKKYLEAAELSLEGIDTEPENGNVVGKCIYYSSNSYIKAGFIDKAHNLLDNMDNHYNEILNGLHIFRCNFPAYMAKAHLVLSCFIENPDYHRNKVYYYCEEVFRLEKEEGPYVEYCAGERIELSGPYPELDANYALGIAYLYYSFKYFELNDYGNQIQFASDANEYLSAASVNIEIFLSICFCNIGKIMNGEKPNEDYEIDLEDINSYIDETNIYHNILGHYFHYSSYLIKLFDKEYYEIEHGINDLSNEIKTCFFGKQNLLDILKIILYWKTKKYAKLNLQIENISKSHLVKIIDPYIKARLVDSGIIDYILGDNKINSSLDLLIGLENVKDKVNEIISYVKIQKMRRDMGINSTAVSLHMLFYGPPGTGKTSVARSIAQEYEALGILTKGHLVEVDRKDLVAGYIGQTAIKTKEVIDKAKGGILFIDEAYSLVRGDDEKDFGREALDTIVKAMEDYREDFVVIMAGYQNEMNNLLLANPGLESRFPFIIKFENYNADQLYNMALRMIKERNYILSDTAKKVLRID